MRSSLANVPGGERPEPSDPTPGVAPPPGTFFRCESCNRRPFEVIDSRFGPEFAVCYFCYEGATP